SIPGQDRRHRGRRLRRSPAGGRRPDRRHKTSCRSREELENHHEGRPILQGYREGMKVMASKTLGGCALAAGIFASGIAAAADPEVAPPPLGASDWVVQVTPYLWASGMQGDISPFPRAPTVEVDVPFSEFTWSV